MTILHSSFLPSFPQNVEAAYSVSSIAVGGPGREKNQISSVVLARFTLGLGVMGIVYSVDPESTEIDDCRAVIFKDLDFLPSYGL